MESHSVKTRFLMVLSLALFLSHAKHFPVTHIQNQKNNIKYNVLNTSTTLNFRYLCALTTFEKYISVFILVNDDLFIIRKYLTKPRVIQLTSFDHHPLICLTQINVLLVSLLSSISGSWFNNWAIHSFQQTSHGSHLIYPAIANVGAYLSCIYYCWNF